MAYLSAEEAQIVLLGLGIYSEAEVPPLVKTELLVAQLQDSIDGWLGVSLGIQTYVENRQSNRMGIVRLEKKPIVNVHDIKYYEPRILSQGEERAPIAFTSRWTFGSGIISTAIPFARFQVTYTAGYDPIPPAAVAAMKLLLIKHAETADDIFDVSGLYGSQRTTTSISLPGGLSKSFAPSSQRSGGAGDGTILDKTLTPLLAKYRTTAVFV
jgi:hypothetical protein